MDLCFSVFGYFFRAWLFGLTGKRPKDAFQYAAINLSKPTFRIPQSTRYNLLLIPKQYFILLRTIFTQSLKTEAAVVLEKENNGIFIYDVFQSEYYRRRPYTEHFLRHEINGAIFKHDLFARGAGLPFVALVFLISLWMPFVFILSLLKKDKAPQAMLGKEMVENFNLLALLKSYKVKELYFFCIFEKDANLATLLIQKQHIKVNKIPSEVPLGLWNSIIVADKLCVCSGYQFDELKHFSNSMFVKETEFWGPELLMENLDKYENPVPLSQRTIGFYSTGAWVRSLENHLQQDMDAEEHVKRSLREFCVKHPEYNLRIFMHPRERWEKYYTTALSNYKAIFQGVNYEFAPKESKASRSFEEANVAVALNTTLAYERLYYGFKMLLMPIGVPNFPLEKSGIRNICVYTTDDLVAKLEREAGLTNNEFFKSNGISNYARYLYN